ncbi:XRE family transcriptional regulator [Inconstantimicrobium mannanitabidum]|uniref:XRE family transcriptional regulator n=1 Tax=Inconstantimicrobium mannanitabidum TaxID=1604901 RepID=A0ACB5RHW5_9CLOT|nr:XRE family transcriptional regulator [Clostridium sp. TW13]GKX68648.1 XRE family transcriptional regulator [Clostridium sp. TW13]
MSRVGEKIKDARIKANITQKILAKKLGVAEKYINDVELGRKIINESFIQKVEKALNVSLNDVSMVATDEDLQKEKEELKISVHEKKQKNVEVDDVWNQAFASVLKNVPVYDSSLKKVLGSRQLAINLNKIEGIPQDKAFYVKVDNDDMIGYRIQSEDLVLCGHVKEFDTTGIYLLELNGEVVIRQLKRLDSAKALILSNKGTVKTETANFKEIKVLAKAVKIEINL